MTLVSVVVPVFQVREELPRCIASLRAQSHTELQILLVDDGSSDGCAELIDRAAAGDARIQAIHQPNGGLSNARNTGLAVAIGEYVTFVDGDDWVHREYVERLLAAVREHDVQVAICGFVRTNSSAVPEPAAEPVALVGPDQALTASFGDEHTLWTIACAKLYARGLWSDLCFPEGRLHEDELTTYRVLARADQIAVLSDALYFYFQRPSSITGRPITEASLRDALLAAAEQLDHVARAGRRDLVPVAAGRVFRKQLALQRARAGAHSAGPDVSQSDLAMTARLLARTAPLRPITWFALAYTRSPGPVGRAYAIYQAANPRLRLRSAVSRVVVAGRRRRTEGIAAPRLRILVGAGWLGGAGGAERALQSMLIALADDTVDVVVRERLDGPLAVIPPNVRVVEYGHWRWWAAGHHGGWKGRVIQTVLNPLRRRLSRPYDIFLRPRAGPALERAARARLSLIIPSGSDLEPAMVAAYDAVAMQAPDNAALAPPGAVTVLLPPPVLQLPEPVRPDADLPQAFVLTVFNPYDPIKGSADLSRMLDSAPLPLVWCHSRRTLDFDIPASLQDHPRIVHVDDPTPAQLRYLYQHCSAYVCLSHREGFGWAIADALRYAPAVISRRTGVLSFSQALAPSVTLVDDPGNIAWSEALGRAQPPTGDPLAWLGPQAFRDRLIEALEAGR